MTYSAVINLPDEMLHIALMNGQARALLCRSTAMARAAAVIHQPSDTALAAMSRLMTGTVMLGVMMKDAGSSVTVTAAGGGPIGKMTAVARGGVVKIAVEHPAASLPLKKDGHLDVGGLVGKNGRLTVIKDMGLREPYVGQINLVSGEMGEDFAKYYAISEQTPSIVALGALVRDGVCLSAGGALVQSLPGCAEETVEALETRAAFLSAISREVADVPLDELARAWFDGLDMRILSREAIACACDCGRGRMEKALIALGRRELEEMIADGEGATLTCHFCRAAHHFTTDDLKALLRRATA